MEISPKLSYSFSLQICLQNIKLFCWPIIFKPFETMLLLHNNILFWLTFTGKSVCES